MEDPFLCFCEHPLVRVFLEPYRLGGQRAAAGTAGPAGGAALVNPGRVEGFRVVVSAARMRHTVRLRPCHRSAQAGLNA
jgi:hypothetical protein